MVKPYNKSAHRFQKVLQVILVVNKNLVGTSSNPPLIFFTDFHVLHLRMLTPVLPFRMCIFVGLEGH